MTLLRRYCVIAGLLMILGAVGLVACFVEQPPLAHREPAAHWVRTSEGWQRAVWLERRTEEPGLHPAVVAIFLTLFSVLVLVACQPPRLAQQTKPAKQAILQRPAQRSAANRAQRLAHRDTFSSW